MPLSSIQGLKPFLPYNSTNYMDINKKNKNQWTPLQVMCRSKIFALTSVKMGMALNLLKRKAKADSKESQLIFQWGCEEDDVNGISQLMKMDIVIREREGESSFLHIATQALAKKTLNYILQTRQWNSNLPNESLETPLAILCHLFSNEKKELVLEMIQVLLAHHADPNALLHKEENRP